MEMKWHPIIDGDLNGIPKDEDLLFTVFDEQDDEQDGETYVIIGWIESDNSYLFGVTAPMYNFYKAKNVKAWMKLPEPYKPTPDKCFKCNHGHLQHDEDSDNWFECELLQRDVPPNGKPEDCPLDR